MDYLLGIVCDKVTRAFKEEDAVGVSVIMKMPDPPSFISAASEMFGESGGYLVIDGICPTKFKCPKNIHLSGDVEAAVAWRNLKSAQGRIVFNCGQLRKRSHSLDEFYKITPSGIVESMARDMANKAPNTPLVCFWEAIAVIAKESGFFALKNVMEFLSVTQNKKSGQEKDLWMLGLIPDSKILTPGVNVRDRILRNQEVIEQLNSMDDAVRRRMAASLVHFNASEKRTYRLLLDYFRSGDSSVLKELDLDLVSGLITKTKNHADAMPIVVNNGASISGKRDPSDSPEQVKPQSPTKSLMDDFIKGLSGDKAAQDRITDFGAAVVDYTKDHDPFDDDVTDGKPSIEDPQTGVTTPFPLAKLDRNLYKLVMASASAQTWGGVILSEKANLRDTITDADSICGESDVFKPFRPCVEEANPFFAKNTSLKTEFARFDQVIKEKGKDSALSALFGGVVDARSALLPYMDAFMRYGHLAVFGCNANASESVKRYVAAWKALYDEFERVEEDMHEISDKEYQHAARCLLSLDVLFIRIGDEWKAVMLPTNPLFLWIYSEVYGQLGKGDYNFSEDEFRLPFLKALKDLPNLINFQLVPREIYALSDSGANDDYILPCSGSQGMLPTFENKTNRYLGSDGLECIEDTIKRYLAFAPYAGNDLRICVVDVPDVMGCVKIVAHCVYERISQERDSSSATLEIYLTETHSGGREVDDLDFVEQDSEVSDLIQSDDLRIKVSHCRTVGDVAEALKKDPVHLAFYFDQSTYQVSYGINTRELYITPLVVTYDFKYDAISQDGEIYPNTDTSNGFLGSYYGILDKTGSTCSQSRVPRTSYLKTEQMDKILDVVDHQYAQWLVAADRVVYNYVPKQGLPIGVKNFGRRNVCIWANKNSRVIQQFVLLLKKYNLHPTQAALVELFNRFGHISGEGLVGIPANQRGASESAISRRKGMLGTVFAAKWYADQHPNSLVASLDSEEGRTWLSKTDEESFDNKRADLVGLRLDSDSGGVVVDVIEVKTRVAESKDFTFSMVDGERMIKGPAADQVAFVLKRLQQIFECDPNDCGNMFVAARRETLKYQVVNECFRSRYLEPSQVQEWSKRLKQVFAGGCPVSVSGTILHVDLENNQSLVADEVGKYQGDSAFEIGVVSLTAGRIQREIFGDAIAEQKSANPMMSPTVESPKTDDRADLSVTEDRIGGALNPQNDMEKDADVAAGAQDGKVRADRTVSCTENVEELVRMFWRACNSFSIRIAECDPNSAKIGPSVIRFYVKLQTGQKIENLRKALPDIGRQISRTKIRIQQVENTDRISVDVVRENREYIPFGDVEMLIPDSDELEQMPILIGQTPEGENIVRRLDEMPHLLVGGTTGSGKSVFLSTLLLSLLIRHPRKEQLQLLITSSKPEDFIAFESLPHLISNGILSNAADAIDYIQNKVFQESERRQKLFIGERVSKISLYNQHMRAKGSPQLPPMVVLVDEFADLADNIDSREERDAFFRTLRQIAQAGRSRGIHLILCTQRPSARLLDTNIKAQLPSRVALTVADANSAKMILDVPDSGAERLQGRGDLLFKDVGGPLLRAQGYSLDLDNLCKTVDDVIR